MPHPHAARVSTAVEELRAVLMYSSDDLPEATRQTWWEVVALLNRAEDEFVGVGSGGEPDVAEGVRLAREAEALLETTSGDVDRARQEVRHGYLDALRTLETVTRLIR